MSSIYKWMIEKQEPELKESSNSKNNKNKKDEKYVQMAEVILERIDEPSSDEDFQEWYMAKCKMTVGIASPCYSKPFSKTSLKAKVKFQDKYGMPFARALQAAALKRIDACKNSNEATSLLCQSFNEDDFQILFPEYCKKEQK